MPAEGFKSITISVDVYRRLEVFAEKTKRSIPKAIEYLIGKYGKEA